MRIDEVSPAERRQEYRFPVRAPVHIEGSFGTTRDVSLHGAYFETDATLQANQKIAFTITIPHPAGAVTLHCEGMIVRVDHLDATNGVAVSVHDLILGPYEN